MRSRALRHQARSYHAGQGDRRWNADGCLRRQARHHAMPGPAGAGVPGRHAFRQSGRGGRRGLRPCAGYKQRDSEKLAASTRQLTEGLTAVAKKHGIVFCAQAVGGMFGLYFRANPPTSYAEVMECDKEAFNRFFHAMLREGVYFAPSAFEAGFVSAAHSDEDISKTLAAAERIFGAWK